jgi:hypothetical protein
MLVWEVPSKKLAVIRIPLIMSPSVAKPTRVVACEGAATAPKRINVVPTRQADWYLNKERVIETVAALWVFNSCQNS